MARASGPFEARGKQGESMRRTKVRPLHRGQKGRKQAGGESASGKLLQTLKHVGVAAHQEDQRGGLRIWLSAALFPLFEGSLIDAKLASKYRPRTAHSLARFEDEPGIDCGKGRCFHFVAAEGELPLAMLLHRGHAFHQLGENLSLGHQRFLLADSWTSSG